MILPFSNPQLTGVMVEFKTILLVVTFVILDNPKQPVPPTVILAWKVDPKIEDAVVVPIGPLMPYPNHSTVVPAGYPEEYIPVSDTEISIALGEQRIVSLIDNFPFGLALLLTMKLAAVRHVEFEGHSAK